jgi:VRR-NUC domain
MATRRRASPEAQIQRAVFQHLRVRGAPSVFAFHPANGGYRKPIEAAILKGLGVVAGVPDVIAIHNGRVFCVELKREGGRATDKQLECLDRLRQAGAIVAIATGLDEALRKLEHWGILCGRSQ